MSLVPQSARAEGAVVRVTIDGPAGCPSAGQVEGAVQRLVGRAAEGGAPLLARLSINAVVPGGAGQLELRLATDHLGVHGERVLRGDSCQALTDSAALILALMLNEATKTSAAAPPAPAPVPQPRPAGPVSAPDVRPATPPSRRPAAPAPPATAAEAPAVRPSPPPLPPPPPPAPPRASQPQATLAVAPPPPAAVPGSRRWSVGAAAAGVRGALPSTSWGPALFAARSTARWRADATSLLFFSRRALAPVETTAGGDFLLLALGARLCRELHGGRVGAGLCGGAEVGVMRAASFGVRAPDTAYGAWAAAGPGVRLDLRVSASVSIFAEAFALAALSRPEFVLDGIGAVHQPGLLTARAALGAERRF